MVISSSCSSSASASATCCTAAAVKAASATASAAADAAAWEARSNNGERLRRVLRCPGAGSPLLRPRGEEQPPSSSAKDTRRRCPLESDREPRIADRALRMGSRPSDRALVGVACQLHSGSSAGSQALASTWRARPGWWPSELPLLASGEGSVASVAAGAIPMSASKAAAAALAIALRNDTTGSGMVSLGSSSETSSPPKTLVKNNPALLLLLLSSSPALQPGRSPKDLRRTLWGVGIALIGAGEVGVGFDVGPFGKSPSATRRR
mmetsp:Transcript_80948/g.203681  ORF Transcript_80948/g.203681 Transcript_80948/m.203681 type:complete len:265 (+) Transcript_80948:245-1039(+)